MGSDGDMRRGDGYEKKIKLILVLKSDNYLFNYSRFREF